MTNTPSEQHRRLIEQGAARLLALGPSLDQLAIATAKERAKQEDIGDWRLCLADACKTVYTIAWRETHRGG
jgi:hypothetical protein